MAAYNPGTPTAARIVNQSEQIYAIDSFRNESKSYLVNLKHSTCDCPAFRKSGPCKHVAAVRQQARYLKLLTIARTLTDANLSRLLVKYTELGDAETAGALRVERHRRRQLAEEDARLKELFR
jgi:uncharacterized Zn finger protein